MLASCQWNQIISSTQDNGNFNQKVYFYIHCLKNTCKYSSCWNNIYARRFNEITGTHDESLRYPPAHLSNASFKSNWFMGNRFRQTKEIIFLIYGSFAYRYFKKKNSELPHFSMCRIFRIIIVIICFIHIFFPILGLNNKRNPRDWEYLSGGTSIAPLLSYTNWGKNQPQTRGRRDRRNCVLVNKRRKWKNKSCTKNLKRFICEGVPGQKFSSLQSSPSDQPNRNRGKRRRRYRWSSWVWDWFRVL